jgi:hypothetical protein
MTDDLPKIDR